MNPCSEKIWNIGITHLVKPPFDPEAAAFKSNAKFHFFDSRNEENFDHELLRKLDAFLVWTTGITQQTIDNLKKGRILVRYGVGFDKIDISALNHAGIAFSNNPEYGPEDVADTAMALLLALQRKILQHDIGCRGYQGSWQENHLSPVHHSRTTTVGVVGVGRIGTSVINRLKPFGYKILGYDPDVSNGMFRALGIERVHSVEELLANVDAITLHCPLTDETRGLINGQSLAAARPGLILVNTARGKLVSDLDVIELGLKSGQLAAVGLDVLPDEPPMDHSLIKAWRDQADWLKGRMYITPHNAFYSDNSMYECRFNAAETARLFLEQQIHRNSITG